ncbi:hypothetical protein KABACHOK_01260 [Brevundimonas phage vB_BpoS-Kabachok]|uniref:Uncharacterized protein n=1 Tax=Brevundimonas phage vB_BpoS-Kabachok TaxID=2948600 RepID=A0A9E7SLN3_9CAUD|nr:hypothetical protein KABACHOK_01260 [Brevundimonas phage vB_BpoS-Kabachok]
MGLSYREFVGRICADGEAEVGLAYTDPYKRAGALRGFSEARETVDADDLKGLLASARQDTEDAKRRAQDGGDEERLVAQYWFARLRDQQLEWVANVVSASRYNMRLPVIVPPTQRAWAKAAEILGRAP